MWWSIAFIALFLVAPLVLCAAWPSAFRFVIVLGVGLAAIEWLLAYRSNQVEHGGDWQPGGELAAYTAFLAAVYFVV